MNQPVMDHWTTVKRIHQSALDVDPSERAAFVHESCGGDEALRREVESLLRVRGRGRVIPGATGGGNRGHPAG